MTALQLCVAVLTLVGNAFFVGAEFSLVSVRRSQIDPIATGLFGLAFGAIIGGAIANGNSNSSGDRVVGRVTGGGYESHVDACYARYRSYDERTDTFMGYDGIRRRCNL